GEHGQGIGTYESGLYSPGARGQTADEGGTTVDESVDTAVVEVNQCPGEVPAGPHERRLVDRIPVEVTAGGHGHSGDRGRCGGGDLRATVLPVGEPDTDSDHPERERGDHGHRQRRFTVM